MAVDMFFKSDDIKGESADDKHKDCIDVLAWSWGISQSGSTHSGTGSGTGKANFQDISFTTYVDLSTTVLMHAVATGKHFSKGSLIVRKAGEKPLEFLKVDIEDFIVSSYSTGGSGGEDRATCNFTLNFAKVKCEYATQDKTGKKGKGGEFGYNIAGNVVL